ncbi:FMN-binding protein [Actinomyces succiniciruminis]|uniref:Prokaryotic membrane lipoprotein lipid attachment site profile n=1 Tax=Actinomyces succiniciruminis TaxID=1522002 RepID=A0A1L7RQP7_9ACTO|nr:FMN-binding protein [Actinomyces succiniciruminis]CED91483.1 Prokaryotic membrane lipoprotein lipid attachment site profile [Actinomyces succiniciruminis]
MRRHALAAVGAVLATAGLAGCGGGEVTPAQDEYAGRAQTENPTAQPAATAGSEVPTASATPTGGPYADGEYTVSEAYGVVDDVVEEDSIDVTLSLQGGYITGVSVTGHALTGTSKNYMAGFVEEIDDAVVGRSIEDAHVTALAGASKTSAAFNDAVDAIAAQAAEAY